MLDEAVGLGDTDARPWLDDDEPTLGVGAVPHAASNNVARNRGEMSVRGFIGQDSGSPRITVSLNAVSK